MNYIILVILQKMKIPGDQVTKVQVSGSSSEIESTTKMHKGMITKAAALSKSSTSFEITPILDQSPLYLYIVSSYTQQVFSILGLRITVIPCVDEA